MQQFIGSGRVGAGGGDASGGGGSVGAWRDDAREARALSLPLYTLFREVWSTRDDVAHKDRGS